jgi:hypothetical protein
MLSQIHEVHHEYIEDTSRQELEPGHSGSRRARAWRRTATEPVYLVPLLGPVTLKEEDIYCAIAVRIEKPGMSDVWGWSFRIPESSYLETCSAVEGMASAVELRDEVYSTLAPRDEITGMSGVWDCSLKETPRVVSSVRRKSWETACVFGPRAPRVSERLGA